MKKTVIVFGLIAGTIVSAFMAISVSMYDKNADYSGSMLVGYAAMLVSFSFVFVGIKNYRDKHNGGVITFGAAFKTGLFITLIASTMYVIVWLFEYYCFFPDFMDKYAEHVLNQAKTSGVSAAELSSKAAEMEKYKEMYKTPLFVILLTYAEILPIGLVITLISALILKRKPKPTLAG